MVKLVRTAAIEGDWEKAAKVLRQLMLEAKESPHVQDSHLYFNVTGRIDEVHWELAFESMAEEEKWVTSLMEDEKYTDHMIELMPELTPPVDRHYREVDFAWTENVGS